MKIGLLLLCFLAFYHPSVLEAQKCYDYDCNIDKARTALNQKNFKEALAYAKAAKAYPNANVSEADILIYEIFERIEAQKKIAEDATKLAKSEAEKAYLEKIKAEEATIRAEKTTRAAENSAVFIETLNTDPALALRMMYYNYMNHPENSMTRNYYNKTIKDPSTVFVKHVFRDSNNINAAVLSPNGKKFLTATKGKIIKVFDLASGHLDKMIELKDMRSIDEVVLSPNGNKFLISGRSDTGGVAKLVDLASGQLEKTFSGHLYGVNTLAYSPDGKKILTGDSEKTRLWDVSTGQVEKTYFGYSGSVAFSPDGKKALIGWNDAVLWDFESGRVEKTFVINNESGSTIYSVAFSPDGKKALISSGSFTKIWDVASGQLDKSFDMPFSDKILISSDGNKLLTGKRSSTLVGSRPAQTRIWDIASGKVEKIIMGELVALTPDMKSILTKDFYNLKLSDIGLDKAEKTFIQAEEVRAVAFSPDGKQVLTGGGQPNGPPDGNNNMVILWNTTSGNEIKTFLGHETFVQAVTFSNDGKKIWSAEGGYGKLKRWDIKTGLEERTALKDKLKDYNVIINFANDREHVSFSSLDTINMWNLKTEQYEGTAIPLKGALAYSPDGKKVLTDSFNRFTSVDVLQLKDVKSGKIEKTFYGHTNFVYAATFSPDGKKILTGSKDRTAKLWDIETEKAEKTFIGHSNDVVAVAFSPDGKKILTGSKDKSAKLWDIENNSIEGWTFPYSLYEMVFAGLTLEEKDIPQYRKDSVQLNSFVKVKPISMVSEYPPVFYVRDNKKIITQTSTSSEEDIVTLLQNQIDETMDDDYQSQYLLYTALIDTLKHTIQEQSEDMKILLAEAYSNRAWCGFFITKYVESEQDIRAGLALNDTDKYLQSELAHALLLQGKFNEAKAEYERWMDKEFDKVNDIPTYRDAFLVDLEAFDEAGIIPEERKADVAAIRKLLEKKE